MKQMLADKNQIPLAKIEEGQQTHHAGSSAKINQMLPPQEYCQTNPNVQVFSEELQRKLEEKQMAILYRQRNQQE